MFTAFRSGHFGSPSNRKDGPDQKDHGSVVVDDAAQIATNPADEHEDYANGESEHRKAPIKT